MPLFNRAESSKTPNLDPHQWNQPRTEFHVSSKHPQTNIPDPAIFRDVMVPPVDQVRSGAQLRYPTPGHLATHLALLECFVRLKEKVMTCPELDILDVPRYQEKDQSNKASITAETAQDPERWNTLVRLAVSRFTVWFENIESILRHATAYHRYGSASNAHHATMTAAYLPPLDVLLVWYVYMNNHAEYQNDNVAHETAQLLEMPLPWEEILAVIDMDSLTYKLPPAAGKLFTTTTTQSADILVYLNQPPPYTDLDPQKAFSLDLETAVHELMDGDSFIQRMHALLWLRSPSLEATLSRALAYYSLLPELTGNQKSSWLTRVNTDLPLELVWRTHMLYPTVFAEYNNSVFEEVSGPMFSTSHEKDSMDFKTMEPVSSTESDIGLEDREPCYCWACERVRDEIPEYDRRHLSATLDDSASESSMDSAAQMLSTLSKDQISEIKADLAFHRFVERFRKSHEPGTTLPTRPLTVRALQSLRAEQASKSRAGTYYGTGYTVEVIRPAIYDRETGKLLQKEKTRVRRPFMNMTGKLGGWSTV